MIKKIKFHNWRNHFESHQPQLLISTIFQEIPTSKSNANSFKSHQKKIKSLQYSKSRRHPLNQTLFSFCQKTNIQTEQRNKELLPRVFLEKQKPKFGLSHYYFKSRKYNTCRNRNETKFDIKQNIKLVDTPLILIQKKRLTSNNNQHRKLNQSHMLQFDSSKNMFNWNDQLSQRKRDKRNRSHLSERDIPSFKLNPLAENLRPWSNKQA